MLDGNENQLSFIDIATKQGRNPQPLVDKQNDMCRYSFRKIHQNSVDLLHAYVLELQKIKSTKINHCEKVLEMN